MAARESTVTYRTAWGNVKWDGRGRRQFSTGKNSPDHGPSHTSMWDFLDPVECFEIVYNNIHIAGNILIMVRTKKFPTPGQSIPPLPPLKIQRRKSEKKVHQPPALPPAIEPGFWKTYHNCCEKFCQALYVKLNLSTEGGVPKVTFCSNIVSSVIICSIIGFLLFVLTWVGPATPGSDGGGDDDHNGGNGGEGAVPFSKSMEAFQAWAKKPFPEPSRVVKKGGGGGQGTWGKLLDTDGESHIDRDDPNCDCGEVFSNRIIPTWHHVKAPAGGKAPTAGIAVRHVRRTHSGKLVRVKKEGGGGKGTWELVERRWGGSTHITVEEVTKKISGLLREYVESGDTLEACRCIRELGVSFYHHEVVKRALILGMETRTAEPLITKLLKEAAEEGIISSSQMTKGFSRLALSLDDLFRDIPSAKSFFQS